MAELLFGHYNPAGRLPLTFYASSNDLPDFEDYDMSNRTYRYFKGKALFPFGHGLSYTSYEYSDAGTDSFVYSPGDKVKVSFSVKNTGTRDGDEISQVYVSQINPSSERPVKELKGFARTSLKSGESKVVEVELPVDDWAFWDEQLGGWNLEKGRYDISIAAASDDIKYVVSVEIK